VRFLLILFFILITQFGNKVVGQDYLWPTNSGHYLSSTFGETRSAHFHAGLDIKTWGREGYKVYAAKDGILYRLLVTERGYGNAIYLKHPNGTFTVYAHLQRFENRFQQLIDSVRLQDFSFEKDLILDSLKISVDQGAVIGYTGSTGIGPPHLHFEIRDSLQHPVNPLNFGFNIQDTIAPVFVSLIIEPLTIDSRVEGKPISHYQKVYRSRNGFSFGKIKASGKVGIAVNVFDQANDVYNAYAIHSLGLKQQDDTLFYQELNHFDYAESHEMFLDRIAPFGSNKRGHQRLYGKEGHNNPFYIINKKETQIAIKDSLQTFTIFASDFFGNTSEATIDLVPAKFQGNTYNPKFPYFEESIHAWYWSENWASPDHEHVLNLAEDIKGYIWSENQILHQSDSSLLNFARLTPNLPQKIVTPNYDLSIRFPENTFFDTLTVATELIKEDQLVRFSIQPEMIPIKSAFSIALYLGESEQSSKNYRLYKFKDQRHDIRNVSYVESYMIGNTLHATPSELGEFVVLKDSLPPEVSEFKIFKTDHGKWKASVNVTDNLSGIDSSSSLFIINGKRGIPVYDYEEELLTFYRPDFDKNDFSNVKATVTIKDKAGNTTTLQVKQ
jgi:hypothetical protein